MRYARESQSLTRHDCEKLTSAWGHAEAIDYPLNVAATVHWASAGGSGTAARRQKILVERTSKWLHRRGASWAAVWVVETGTAQKDIHTHLALHLPSHISLKQFDAYWRQQLASLYQNVLKVKPVRDIGWLRYMLKGADDEVRRTFSVPRHLEDARCLVIGKRCGVSQNLGPKAIAQHAMLLSQQAA
jgi:hypothetical protein